MLEIHSHIPKLIESFVIRALPPRCELDYTCIHSIKNGCWTLYLQCFPTSKTNAKSSGNACS